MELLLIAAVCVGVVIGRVSARFSFSVQREHDYGRVPLTEERLRLIANPRRQAGA